MTPASSQAIGPLGIICQVIAFFVVVVHMEAHLQTSDMGALKITTKWTPNYYS